MLGLSRRLHVLKSFLYPKISAKHEDPRAKPLTIPFSQFRTFKTSPKDDDHNSPQLPSTRSLLKKLASKVVSLTCKSSADPGVCNVILVGVIHRTKESRELVQAVVRFVKPQVLFLELCPERAKKLECPQVLVDSEFRVAYEEAARYGGKVILGDRRQSVISEMAVFLSRAVAVSLFPNSFRSFKNEFECLERYLEVTNDDEVDLDAITTENQIWSKVLPTIVEVLVHERDKYMSKHLLKTASEHNSVVAVVGRGHLPGIEMNWKQSIQARELSDTSVQKPVAKTTT